MNNLLAGCLLLFLAAPCHAAGGEGQPQVSGFSFISSFLQMCAALLLVVGLILLTYYASTRLLRKVPALSQANRQIRVVEVRAMAPRKSLILVEVGGEYLLLADSGEHLTFIKQINMLDEIEVLNDTPDQQSFRAILKRTLGRA